MSHPLTSLEPLLPVIQRQPFGLMSDIDGTLAPIVPRPEDARVPEATRSLLADLIGKGAKVGLITGRSLEAARMIGGVDGAAYAADHGLVLWVEGHPEPAPGLAHYESLARRLEEELQGLAEAMPGVQLENKGPLLAVHYRRADDPEAARKAALEAISDSMTSRRFQVREGRLVIELRPPLPADKGTALETLAGRLGLAGLLCLGDDATDIDMFEAARRLSAKGVAAASVAVASEEAAPEVAAAADYALESADRVAWLLAEVLRALP